MAEEKPARQKTAKSRRRRPATAPRLKPPPANAWQKGKSGNPGGRPKIEGHIRELARQLCPEAIETLGQIMRDTAQPAAARVTAAKEILDRGIGRPIQAVEVSGNDGQPIPMAYLPTRSIQRVPEPDSDPDDPADGE